MARTVKRTGGRFLPSAMWCWCSFVLLLAFHMDGASADTSNSSSIVSSDGQTGDSTLTTMEKGMRPFFDMVKSFLGVIQPHKLSEQTWLNFSDIYVDGQFKTEQFEDWQDWATYLIGFVVCAAVGVLFFIVMPILGIIFCCCRCCGKCGGRHKPDDPKRAGCKRKTYCTVLLLLNTVTLAGVVCAFLSNEIVYNKLRNENDVGPVGKLTATLDHIDRFANSTVEEIEEAVLDGFIRAKDNIINRVRSTASVAVGDVLNSLNATALLDQTKDLSKVVNKTQSALANVADQLSTLSSYGTWLKENLTQIADDVSSACQSAGSTVCGNFNRNKYGISADFSMLKNLSSQASSVANSVNLSQYIKEAEEKINQTKNSTTQSVDEGINNATRSVGDVQKLIERGVNQVKTEVGKAVTSNAGNIRSDLLRTQEDMSKYGKYWWYAGLGVSCVLLLVVVLYYMGVLFGLCGERPGMGAQCCNTGTGANFLMAGVGFTFMLAWLVMLVCLILFMTGGPVYTEVCRYFVDHKPQELKPFNDALMGVVDIQKTFFDGKDVNVDLVKILRECERNDPVYRVMKLENMVNLTQYTDLTQLREALGKLTSEQLVVPDVTIVTSQLNQSISDFANAGLEKINFTDFYSQVNKNLTNAKLSELAENLRSIAYQTNAGSDQTFRGALRGNASKLDKLQSDLVLPMRAAVTSLNTSLTYLQTQAHGEIQPATMSLLSGLQTAQNNFNAMKDNLVKVQLKNVVNRVLNATEVFVDGILAKVQDDVGRCRPLFDSFYSATDSVCVVVLEPLNGFWFSVGWCLFFFIPCLIFAVKLAGLYRREHDEKDFNDPNYILYGGHNQDTIPLTSVDRGHPSAYHPPASGMSNSAYHRDSYLGPADKYAPPPYTAPSHGMGSAGLIGSTGGGGGLGRDPRGYPY
ncbi:prominin-1-like isoform X2 [Littorina saxatilis]|uniref:prominin-1-like isoform X2 n=1 Tax=Littorina saxatilis TaxID=31220 RepID=UPI0038B5AA61